MLLQRKQRLSQMTAKLNLAHFAVGCAPGGWVDLLNETIGLRVVLGPEQIDTGIGCCSTQVRGGIHTITLWIPALQQPQEDRLQDIFCILHVAGYPVSSQ